MASTDQELRKTKTYDLIRYNLIMDGNESFEGIERAVKVMEPTIDTTTEEFYAVTQLALSDVQADLV